MQEQTFESQESDDVVGLLGFQRACLHRRRYRCGLMWTHNQDSISLCGRPALSIYVMGEDELQKYKRPSRVGASLVCLQKPLPCHSYMHQKFLPKLRSTHTGIVMTATRRTGSLGHYGLKQCFNDDSTMIERYGIASLPAECLRSRASSPSTRLVTAPL